MKYLLIAVLVTAATFFGFDLTTEQWPETLAFLLIVWGGAWYVFRPSKYSHDNQGGQ